MSIEFRRAFRALLFPITTEQEAEALANANDHLAALGIVEADRPTWLRQKLAEWRENGAPSAGFKRLARATIKEGDSTYGEVIAARYFSLHKTLVDDYLFTLDEASSFLMQSPLICRLSAKENMSAAQVANILKARDHRTRFSRQTVDKLLGRFGTKRPFEREQVELAFDQDAALEESILADADLTTAGLLIADVGRNLGVPINLAALLTRLADPAKLDKYAPYLQMLHYQCTIPEFLDHPVTDIYEFKPRGERVTWLMEQYPTALVNAANPFLNNAKSVEHIDFGWARSKKSANYPGAMALTEILMELNALGPAARRELAGWLRLWLHRVMRYAQPIGTELPDDLTAQQIQQLLKAVAANESQTAGVIEQRLVDALTSVMHTPADGWKPRGLKDAVNATNVSRKKVGDVDYQKNGAHCVKAYEAHGGILSETYLQGHLQTLPKSLNPRQEEWSAFSDPASWTVDVVFVAHQINATNPGPMNIDGTTVNFELITYEDLIDCCSEIDLSDAINTLVLNPLSEKRTPNRVREKLLAMTAGA